MRYMTTQATIDVIQRPDILLVSWNAQGDWERHTAIKEDFRAAFVPPAWWVQSDRAWHVSVMWEDALLCWLTETFDPAGVRWRAGAGGAGQSRRRESGPRHATMAPKQVDPYAVLHLRPDAPLWAAEAVCKAAVKQAHPDLGGSDGHAAMVRLNQAIERLRAIEEASAAAS